MRRSRRALDLTAGLAALALAGAAGAQEPPSPPAPAAEPTVVAPVTGGDAPAIAAATEATDPDGKRPYNISGAAQLRLLAVADEDPANDRAMVWKAAAMVDLFPQATAFLRFGLLQRFVAEQDESGLRLQDTQAGMSYRTPVDLGWRELTLVHEGSVFLPTSRASQRQDLYIAPQYALMASLEPVSGLTVALIPSLRYRWHQFAERAGEGAGQNTRLDLGTRLGVDWAAADFGRYGKLGVGGSVGSTWLKKYAARDDHESDTSEAAPWFQVYDWETHVVYGLAPLTFMVSVEHGGAVLRDGIVNTFLVHRDETELAFTLGAVY